MRVPPRDIGPPTPERVARTLESNHHKKVKETQFEGAMDTLAPTAVAKPVLQPTLTQGSSRAPRKGLTIDGEEMRFRDWTGVVLVPVDLTISKLHVLDVDIEHVEAHPLQDGSLRVWARVRNKTRGVIAAELGCYFHTHEHPDGPATRFFPVSIEPNGIEDIFFV